MTDPTPLPSAAGGSFENVPTAMVFDTFTEAAAALRSHYMRPSDEAQTALEPDVWWAGSWTFATQSRPLARMTGTR